MAENKKITEADRERSAKARRARESGRSISHYTKEFAREIATPKKRATGTPSKRG